MTAPQKKQIAIIGAGVTGLSAAWDLARAGHAVTIYEAEPTVGGLASGFKDEHWDWTLEKYYHHWFEGDRHMLGIIDELGLSDKVIFPRPKTSFWIDGKILRSEISPLSVLTLPLKPLSLIRFALAGAFIKLTPFWKPLEKVTAHDWMRRYMGEEGYNKFFRPLLIGKFGEQYKDVNMAWMWARIVSRSLKLGTFEGGFQNFLNLFAEKLQAQGVTIHLGTPIQGIDLDGTQPTVTVDGTPKAFDHVISTTSPRLMLKLAPRLQDTAYGDTMRQLKSIGGLVVVYALKQRLMPDDTYWLSLPSDTADKAKNEFPFLAMVEHTNFIDKSHYGDDVLVYCGDYVPADHEYFQMSEAELIERFTPALKKVNPNFQADWIRKTWVFRAPYAQPVPLVNHSENILPVETPIPGVLWASMSQVYPWDRGTNFSVELGRRAAQEILK